METYSRHMINIRLHHHRAHRPLDISRLEFVIGVFVPYRLQIEIGPIHEFLEEGEVAGVGEGFAG